MAREQLISQRTGIINRIRAFLLQRGVAVRQGPRFLRPELPRILATPSDVLSPRTVDLIDTLAEDCRRLDERIDHSSSEIAKPIDHVPTVRQISARMLAAVATIAFLGHRPR